MPRQPTCLCGECRKCKHRDYMRGWYQRKTPEERRAWVERRDPEAVRASDSARYYRDWEKRQESRRRYRSTSPEQKREYNRRYPEKTAARSALAKALRRGEIIKPDACSDCGKGCDSRHLHGHHEDYGRPYDVVWVCPRCHGVRHRTRECALNRTEEKP